MFNEEQLDLFEVTGTEIEETSQITNDNPTTRTKPQVKRKNTTLVIKDDQEVEMEIDEIFDKKYTDIRIVTYSIDSRFINKHLSHFKNMELIVGIQDDAVQARGFASMGVVANNMVEHIISSKNDEVTNNFQEMSRENQQSIIDGNYRFKIPIKYAIHSKFYLLSNDKETRCITGSANLSEQAFNSNSNQHELIIIEDNSPKFDILLEEFNFFSESSVDYFNKALIKEAKVKSRKRNEDSKVIPLSFTVQEQSTIKVDGIKLFFKEAIEIGSEGDVSEAQKMLEEMVSAPQNISNIKKAKDKDKRDAVSAVELVREVVNTQNKNSFRLASDKVVRSKILNKITVKLAKHTDEALQTRPILISAPEQRIGDNTGLYYSNNNETIIDKSLGQLASNEEIKASIKHIQELIHNYENYVVDYNHIYGTRVIEAILYAFTSPFLWEIKSKPDVFYGARTIPQFMILGGTANSGKSKLLEIIKLMMGLYGSQEYYTYDRILPAGTHNKVSKTIDFINISMSETNVTPLLVDEIDDDFFSNKRRGEDLIVNTSNYYENQRSPMPAFIGTTNTSNYSMDERGKSRTYYIKIDRVFDEAFEEQSSKAFAALRDKIDDKLFQDFIVRFSKRLEDDELNWANYPSGSNTGSVDFLYHTREIFKEYFEIAGIRLPEWFPITRYDDKKDTEQELWRKQYERYTERFKVSSDKSVYLFNLKELDEHEVSGGYGRVNKPSDFYRQSIPQKVLVSTGGTDIIEIKIDDFHKWIGLPRPKAGFFAKLFNKK